MKSVSPALTGHTSTMTDTAESTRNEHRALKKKWLDWADEKLLDIAHLQTCYNWLLEENMARFMKTVTDTKPRSEWPAPTLLRGPAGSIWESEGCNPVLSAFNLMSRIRTQISERRRTCAKEVSSSSETSKRQTSDSVDRETTLRGADNNAVHASSGDARSKSIDALKRCISSTLYNNPNLIGKMLSFVNSMARSLPLQSMVNSAPNIDPVVKALTTLVNDSTLSERERAEALGMVIQLKLARGTLSSVFDAIQLCLEADITSVGDAPPALRQLLGCSVGDTKWNGLCPGEIEVIPAHVPLARLKSVNALCALRGDVYVLANDVITVHRRVQSGDYDNSWPVPDKLPANTKSTIGFVGECLAWGFIQSRDDDSLVAKIYLMDPQAPQSVIDVKHVKFSRPQMCKHTMWKHVELFFTDAGSPGVIGMTTRSVDIVVADEPVQRYMCCDSPAVPSQFLIGSANFSRGDTADAVASMCPEWHIPPVGLWEEATSISNCQVTAPIGFSSRVVSVVGNNCLALCLTDDGDLFCKGNCEMFGVGGGYQASFTPVSCFQRCIRDSVAQIAFHAHASHVLVLTTDGRVFGCGCNSHMELGEAGDDVVHGFRQIFVEPCKFITNCLHKSAAITMDGRVLQWGAVARHTVGPSGVDFRSDGDVVDMRPKAIRLAFSHMFVLSKLDQLYACASECVIDPKLTKNPVAYDSVHKITEERIAQFDSSTHHVVGLTFSGDVVAYGSNSVNQLGVPTSHPPVARTSRPPTFPLMSNTAYPMVYVPNSTICGRDLDGWRCYRCGVEYCADRGRWYSWHPPSHNICVECAPVEKLLCPSQHAAQLTSKCIDGSYVCHFCTRPIFSVHWNCATCQFYCCLACRMVQTVGAHDLSALYPLDDKTAFNARSLKEMQRFVDVLRHFDSIPLDENKLSTKQVDPSAPLGSEPRFFSAGLRQQLRDIQPKLRAVKPRALRAEACALIVKALEQHPQSFFLQVLLSIAKTYSFSPEMQLAQAELGLMCGAPAAFGSRGDTNCTFVANLTSNLDPSIKITSVVAGSTFSLCGTSDGNIVACGLVPTGSSSVSLPVPQIVATASRRTCKHLALQTWNTSEGFFCVAHNGNIETAVQVTSASCTSTSAAVTFVDPFDNMQGMYSIFDLETGRCNGDMLLGRHDYVCHGVDTFSGVVWQVLVGLEGSACYKLAPVKLSKLSPLLHLHSLAQDDIPFGENEMLQRLSPRETATLLSCAVSINVNSLTEDASSPDVGLCRLSRAETTASSMQLSVQELRSVDVSCSCDVDLYGIAVYGPKPSFGSSATANVVEVHGGTHVKNKFLLARVSCAVVPSNKFALHDVSFDKPVRIERHQPVTIRVKGSKQTLLVPTAALESEAVYRTIDGTVVHFQFGSSQWLGRLMFKLVPRHETIPALPSPLCVPSFSAQSLLSPCVNGGFQFETKLAAFLASCRAILKKVRIGSECDFSVLHAARASVETLRSMVSVVPASFWHRQAEGSLRGSAQLLEHLTWCFQSDIFNDPPNEKTASSHHVSTQAIADSVQSCFVDAFPLTHPSWESKEDALTRCAASLRTNPASNGARANFIAVLDALGHTDDVKRLLTVPSATALFDQLSGRPSQYVWLDDVLGLVRNNVGGHRPAGLLSKLMSSASSASDSIISSSGHRHISFSRFSSNSNIGWGYSGSRDSICVTVSTDVMLVGVGLFGNNNSAKYEADIAVCAGDTFSESAVVSRVTAAYSTNTPKPAVCYFDTPALLRADTRYHVSAAIKGPSSYSGSRSTKGADQPEEFTVTISAAKGSTNGTSTSGGQIPVLLFQMPTVVDTSSIETHTSWDWQVAEVPQTLRNRMKFLASDIEITSAQSKVAAGVTCTGKSLCNVRKTSRVPVAILSSEAFALYDMWQFTVEFLDEPADVTAVGICTPEVQFVTLSDTTKAQVPYSGLCIVLTSKGEVFCNDVRIACKPDMEWKKAAEVMVRVDLFEFKVSFVVNGDATFTHDIVSVVAEHHASHFHAVCSSAGSTKEQRWRLLDASRLVNENQPAFQHLNAIRAHGKLLVLCARIFREATDMVESFKQCSADDVAAGLANHTMVKELLPRTLLHTARLCQISPLAASSMLPFIEKLRRALSQLFTHANMTGGGTTLSAPSLWSSHSGAGVVVQSDHPIKSPSRHTQRVQFPQHTQFLTINFDEACSFASVQDYLSVFTEDASGTRTLVGTYTGRRLAAPDAAQSSESNRSFSRSSSWPAAKCGEPVHDLNTSTNETSEKYVERPLVICGNCVVFETSVLAYDQPVSPSAAESFGFRCMVRGHFIQRPEENTLLHLQRELQNIFGLCCAELSIGQRAAPQNASLPLSLEASRHHRAASALFAMPLFSRGFLDENIGTVRDTGHVVAPGRRRNNSTPTQLLWDNTGDARSLLPFSGVADTRIVSDIRSELAFLNGTTASQPSTLYTLSLLLFVCAEEQLRGATISSGSVSPSGAKPGIVQDNTSVTLDTHPNAVSPRKLETDVEYVFKSYGFDYLTEADIRTIVAHYCTGLDGNLPDAADIVAWFVRCHDEVQLSVNADGIAPTESNTMDSKLGAEFSDIFQNQQANPTAGETPCADLGSYRVLHTVHNKLSNAEQPDSKSQLGAISQATKRLFVALLWHCDGLQHLMQIERFLAKRAQVIKIGSSVAPMSSIVRDQNYADALGSFLPAFRAIMNFVCEWYRTQVQTRGHDDALGASDPDIVADIAVLSGNNAMWPFEFPNVALCPHKKRGDGIDVFGPAKNKASCITASCKPVPPTLRHIYFEVRIADEGTSGASLRCGFSSSSAPQITFDCRLGHATNDKEPWVCTRASEGDVIGCALDRTQQVAYFTLNGLDLGKRYPVNPDIVGQLRPCIVFHEGMVVEVNLGHRPFLHQHQERRRSYFSFHFAGRGKASRELDEDEVFFEMRSQHDLPCPSPSNPVDFTRVAQEYFRKKCSRLSIPGTAEVLKRIQLLTELYPAGKPSPILATKFEASTIVEPACSTSHREEEACELHQDDDLPAKPVLQRSVSAPVASNADISVGGDAFTDQTESLLLAHAFWREKLKQSISDTLPLILRFVFAEHHLEYPFTAAAVLRQVIRNRSTAAQRYIAGFVHLSSAVKAARTKYDELALHSAATQVDAAISHARTRTSAAVQCASLELEDYFGYAHLMLEHRISFSDSQHQPDVARHSGRSVNGLPSHSQIGVSSVWQHLLGEVTSCLGCIHKVSLASEDDNKTVPLPSARAMNHALECWKLDFKAFDHQFIQSSRVFPMIREYIHECDDAAPTDESTGASDGVVRSSLVQLVPVTGFLKDFFKASPCVQVSASSNDEQLRQLLVDGTLVNVPFWSRAQNDKTGALFFKSNSFDHVTFEPPAHRVGGRARQFVTIKEISLLLIKGRGGSIPNSIIALDVESSSEVTKALVPAGFKNSASAKAGVWITLSLPQEHDFTSLKVVFVCDNESMQVRVWGVRVFADAFCLAGVPSEDGQPVCFGCDTIVPRPRDAVVYETALRVFQYLARAVFSGLTEQGVEALEELSAKGASSEPSDTEDDPDDLVEPSLRRQLSREQSGLRQHVASLLFSDDADGKTHTHKELSALQSTLFELLRDEMKSQFDLWDSCSQDYVFQLTSLLLGLSKTNPGLAYIAAHLEVVAASVGLFPVINHEVQAQVIQLCERILSYIERYSDETVFTVCDTQLRHSKRRIPCMFDSFDNVEMVPPGGVLVSRLCQYFGTCFTVQVRRRLSGRMRTEELDAAHYLLGKSAVTTRKVAKELLLTLKNLVVPGSRVERLLVQTFKNTVCMGVTRFVTCCEQGQAFAALQDSVLDPEREDYGYLCMDGVHALLLSAAVLAALGEDAIRLLGPWASADGDDFRPSMEKTSDSKVVAPSQASTCELHDDGITLARFECSDCKLHLCTECDNVRHLHPSRRNHSRTDVVHAMDAGHTRGETAEHRSVFATESKQVRDPDGTNVIAATQSKPTELKFSDGCATFVASSLRVTVDIAKLHVHIDVRAAVSSEQLSLCRYCGGDLPTPGTESEGSADSDGASVCGNEECQEKLAASCRKRLPCGHRCVGCSDERECMPCVFGCQPECGINAHDKCRICSAEDLCEGPCVLLECGHTFHYLCIKEKLKYRWELQGPRISFAFMSCPLCRQPMKSPAIASLIDPLLKMKDTVEKMVLLRLEYENLANHASLKKGGEFYQDKIGFGMNTFAYYECFKCNRPYYGGRHECADDLEAEG